MGRHKAVPHRCQANEFADESLDFVVVDGHYPQACVRAAIDKLKPNGLLLIDGWNRFARAGWGVPDDFSLVHLSANAVTETAIWRR